MVIFMQCCGMPDSHNSWVRLIIKTPSTVPHFSLYVCVLQASHSIYLYMKEEASTSLSHLTPHPLLLVDEVITHKQENHFLPHIPLCRGGQHCHEHRKAGVCVLLLQVLLLPQPQCTAVLKPWRVAHSSGNEHIKAHKENTKEG